MNDFKIKVEVVDTVKQISDLVDWLVFHHESPERYEPTMYLDLEGVNLCREGSISVLTLLIDTGIPTARVCLVDVYSLGLQVFTTASSNRKTLKDILQDDKNPKIFFDVRNDSDALFAHFGVSLQGVEDVQLMENAKRTTTGQRKYLNGLSKCVESDLLYRKNLTSWKLAKEKGQRLFEPRQGGSYDIFNQRPMHDDIISYCVGDVSYLPALWKTYRMMTTHIQNMIREEAKKRVVASQKPDYQPHGANRALAPWSKDQNTALDQYHYIPPSRDSFHDDYFSIEDDGDFEDWTRMPWEGPPS